jgi:XTP/dITP diphosphohydrolase
MNQLLIATTNPGKLNEFKHFLSDIPIKLVSLKDLGITAQAPEHGATFDENAISKAKFYSQQSGLPAIADDGGFEIDALNGEPGVKSHRWIHQDREDTDEELIAYTMEKMKGLPREKRGAQLRLVLALILPDKSVHTVEEKVRGIVAEEPALKRTPGFPYRALLYIPELQKYYDFNDLTPEETEKYNHRGKAALRLKPIIEAFYGLSTPQT